MNRTRMHSSLRTLRASAFGALAVAAGAALAVTARADVRPYSEIPADQAESITTPDHLMSVVRSGAPTAIWQALEHAEVVECLECIPVVAPLLYDANARNREIAAWWLRRRSFGVFGPNEVYQQTLNTLASGSNPTNRAYAASAIGEFLVTPGIKALATAVTTDSDAGVRAAAASALGRINDDGSGALSKAFADSDPTVRAAAYVAAGKINSFSDTVSASAVTGDSDPTVRRVGIELLDTMHATDAATALLKVAQTDPVDEVRLVACHALGDVGDSSMADALATISENDSNQQVRDQAGIANIKLSR